MKKTYQKRITLKAFANSAQGWALATLGKGVSFVEDPTLKELRRRLLTAKGE